MPINIDEIKKLPDVEKLKLIDEILESIDKKIIDYYLAEEDDDATDNILKERWEKYQSGKMKFDSWENVYERLKRNAANWQQKEKDDL